MCAADSPARIRARACSGGGVVGQPIEICECGTEAIGASLQAVAQEVPDLDEGPHEGHRSEHVADLEQEPSGFLVARGGGVVVVGRCCLGGKLGQDCGPVARWQFRRGVSDGPLQELARLAVGRHRGRAPAAVEGHPKRISGAAGLLEVGRQECRTDSRVVGHGVGDPTVEPAPDRRQAPGRTGHRG